MRRTPIAVPGDSPLSDDDAPGNGPRPYFLLIDDRFKVPVFVFVELKPKRRAREVSIEFAPAGPGVRRCWVGVGAASSLGRHPEHLDRFREFPNDAQARAAGYVPIEPRYVGPSWESYLGAFRPEGERPPKLPAVRPAAR